LFSNDDFFHDVNIETIKNELSNPSKDVNNDNAMPNSNEVPKDPKYTSLIPYTPTLPFPQRMTKAKLNLQFGKFLEVLKKVYINIPFTSALT